MRSGNCCSYLLLSIVISAGPVITAGEEEGVGDAAGVRSETGEGVEVSAGDGVSSTAGEGVVKIELDGRDGGTGVGSPQAASPSIRLRIMRTII
jgi:hypothetical protein